MHRIHFLILFFVVLLVGCGGGGGGGQTPAATSSDAAASTPGPTATVSTVVASPTPTASSGLTEDQRSGVMNAIGSMADQLDTSDMDAYRKQLQAFIASQPGIAASGIQDSTVFACFDDGEVITIMTQGTSAAALRATAASPSSGRKTAESAAVQSVRDSSPPPSNLPASNAAAIINVIPLFDNTASSTVAEMLSSSHYNVTRPKGTLNDFAALGGGTGIVFFEGHAGVAGPVLKTVLGNFVVNSAFLVLETDERVPTKADGSINTAAETVTKSLLIPQNGNPPAIARTYVSDTEGTSKRQSWHYGITSTFVRQFMSNFAQDSLFFANCCQGGSPAATDFRVALKEKNVSVYMGWTGDVQNDDAVSRSELVFDRLLGANRPVQDTISILGFDHLNPLATLQESPPQRPFDYVSVFDWIGTLRPLSTQPSLSGQQPIELKVVGTSGSNFGMLAPSIQLIDVQDGNTLRLTGLFGDNALGDGQVSLNGAPLNISSWTSTAITATGTVAEGSVVVSVRGVNSNPVPLTQVSQSTITVSSSLNEFDDFTPSPANYAYNSETTVLNSGGTITFGLLGDFHGYRTAPHGAVVMQAGQANAGTAQVTSYSISGSEVWVFKNTSVSNLVVNAIQNPAIAFPQPGKATLSSNGDGTYTLSAGASWAKGWDFFVSGNTSGGFHSPGGVNATLKVTLSPLSIVGDGSTTTTRTFTNSEGGPSTRTDHFQAALSPGSAAPSTPDSSIPH